MAKPFLTLDDEFGFGKHMFDQVEDVVYDDPEYIAWLIEQDVAEFDDKARELIKKRRIA